MSIDYDVRLAAGEVLGMDAADIEARPYDTPFLTNWQLWMVDDGCDPPTFVYVATRDGATIVPTFEDGFSSLVAVEPINVMNEDAAVDYIKLFFRATRPSDRIVSGIDDVKALDEDVAADLSVEIVPPVVEKTASGGWSVTAFLIDTGNLVRAEIDIAVDGAITSELEEMAKDLSFMGVL